MTPLLARRLLLIAGKGGVGKTTTAVALALLAVRRGLRVRLDVVGGEPPRLAHDIETAALAGRAALDEYLARILPGPLHRRIVHSRLYARFAAGAPGLADLMLLGKIADDARSGAWDLVIADIGPTGHASEMLGMPAAAALAFAGGRVLREVDRIRRELADPAHTALVPVAVPEQLALDEARELVARAGALAVALGPLVINRVHAPTPPVPTAGAAAAPLVREALRRACAHATHAELDRRAIARHPELAATAVHLPELMVDEIGRAELDLLAATAGAQL
jgi:anion-transporting  ArsA/GET3 family ATPase